MNIFQLSLKKRELSLAIAALCFSGYTLAAPEFSANLELDLDAGDTAETETVYDENGFVELNVSSTRNNGDYFVKTKGGVRLTTDGDNNVVVRDSYIQFGNSAWDLQIGRFEAINLFPLGKDTVISHAGGVAVYEANKVRGFVGNDGGQIVLHANASDSVSFELDTLFGDDDASGDNETAFAGIRPSVTFSSGAFSLTAGMERVKYDLIAGGEIDQTGIALTSTFNLGGATVNVAVASLEDDSTAATSEEVMSYVANFTAGNFGAGIIFSEEDVTAASDDPEVMTTYLAYSVPLLGVDGATVTFAGSFSEADNATTADDEATALRVRFNYDF